VLLIFVFSVSVL